MQQFHISNMQGPGEPVVTVARVKKGGPDGVVDGGPKGAKVSGQTPAPPRQLKAGEPGSEPATVNGQKVYSYVDQMPQLPGGGGQPAIVQAIASKIVYPKAAPGETLPAGRVFASFTIDADGAVQGPKIVKSLSPAFDEAVLSAIKQLPRFEPGKQGGQPVAVSFTVPIQFQAKP
jgi:TonB family protein